MCALYIFNSLVIDHPPPPPITYIFVNKKYNNTYQKS